MRLMPDSSTVMCPKRNRTRGHVWQQVHDSQCLDINNVFVAKKLTLVSLQKIG